MPRPLPLVIWILVALAGAGAFAFLALSRGESVNAAWLLTAAVCTYVIGYRFYSKWIAARVLMLNDRRATPCEVNDDGNSIPGDRDCRQVWSLSPRDGEKRFARLDQFNGT